MKRNLRNKFVSPFLLVVVLITACSKDKHADHADEYTCPMHSTVISDKPGVCPVCGMELVRKARAGEEVKITEDLAKLIKSPNEVVASSINTIKPAYRSMDVTVETTGIVTYDSRNVFTIAARTTGRLEKVYLKYPFQQVAKGQKIAEVYSPELIAAQREFIYLLESDPGNTDLVNASKNKLLLLGFPDGRIDDLVRRKEPTLTFPIYSPHDGYVINDDQSAPVISASSIPDMNSMASNRTVKTSPVSENPGELIRAGSYVNAGQTIFKIIDTSSMFVELSLRGGEAAGVKNGDQILLHAGDTVLHKQVGFVQPYFDRGEEFLTVRIYVKRNEGFRIGELVKATISVHSSEAIWVPKESIVDLGLDRVVFVKDREVFRARKVNTGMRADDWIEIKSGLATSEELASNAQYMVDSESFIKSR